ncbi:hypothetical protein EJ110_NYTH14496 [Nymphaea thermarum]|nr:hypothetical protein EJ110_NYTH14496 [Nymphaea thermarum]
MLGKVDYFNSMIRRLRFRTYKIEGGQISKYEEGIVLGESCTSIEKRNDTYPSQDYSLNRTTGEFSVSLGDQCQITLPPDNYVATYKRTVTGKVAEGKIGQLDGIQVWAIFKWWSITAIKASGENLVFEVGMVSAKFPTKNFDESPDGNLNPIY